MPTFGRARSTEVVSPTALAPAPKAGAYEQIDGPSPGEPALERAITTRPHPTVRRAPSAVGCLSTDAPMVACMLGTRRPNSGDVLIRCLAGIEAGALDHRAHRLDDRVVEMPIA